MTNSFNKNIAVTILCGGVVYLGAFFAGGCSQSSPSSPASKPQQQTRYIPFVANIGISDTFPTDSYGNFYTYEGSSESLTLGHGDTVTTSSPAGSRAVAIFGGSGDTIGAASLNGTSYSTWLDPASNTQYEINSATFHTDGTNNIYTYTVQGNTYRDTMDGAIGNVTVNSPSFKQVISKSSDLTVTWTASSFDSDYVEVTFTQDYAPPPIDSTKNDTLSNINDSLGAYYALVDDNGSVTIPSSVLSHCTAPSATITIARGYYKEVAHGSRKYLFVEWSSQAIDVLLQ